MTDTIHAHINKLRSLNEEIQTLEHSIQEREKDDALLNSIVQELSNDTLKRDIAELRVKHCIDSELSEIRMKLYTLYNTKRTMTDEIKSLFRCVSEETHMCPICLERNVNSFIKNCGHSFCEQCIRNIRYMRCPVCREDFSPSDIRSLIFS